MRSPSPTSRTLRNVNLSIADIAWAVASPIAALYLRDADILSRVPWSMVGSYWIVAVGFSVLAFLVFRINDEIPHYFSVHGALDIIKAVAFAELTTFVSGGGNIYIEDYEGNAIWTPILGYNGAPGVIADSGCTGDPGVPTAA